jgi:hypothetical protein
MRYVFLPRALLVHSCHVSYCDHVIVSLSQAKKINKKVMGMIEKAEGEYTELLRKRKVVENDKKKIETVIENLDAKKKIELERVWKKVNKDFGSIFSTLLPGTSAKLEPPEGMQAWEGLEVKIAFGDIWKESLSELSGGQRSLIALSLILALLLYKPAPMYILDEVDAALDLSHTQNIGNMLRTHFSQSQFIVVSLKVRLRTALPFVCIIPRPPDQHVFSLIYCRRECSTTPMSSSEPSSWMVYRLCRERSDQVQILDRVPLIATTLNFRNDGVERTIPGKRMLSK